MATILCIEDEADIREDIVESLESAGHKILEAHDGLHGLEMILQHEPDMVVSDITMPNKTGHELLRELRADHPQFATMPFIFLSALADNQHILDGMDLGADDYLTKPINFALLERKVDARLREIARIKEQSDQDLVKLFRALTTPQGNPSDAGVEATAKPAGTANEAVTGFQEGDDQKATYVFPENRERDTSPPPGTDAPSDTETAGSSRKRVFGAILQFDKIKKAGDQLGEERHKVLDWVTERASGFLKRVLSTGASLTRMPNDGILICYKEGSKDEVRQQSKEISKKLQDHLRADEQLDELAQTFPVPRQTLADLIFVTETLYETELALEELEDPEKFSAAIQEKIDEIHADKSAPAKLAVSIKEEDGHVKQLNLSTRNGDAVPIKFFEFDGESRQKIRASLALFGEKNLIDARCRIDLLKLDFLMSEARTIDPKNSLVVDVHFDTLMSAHCLNLYLPKFVKFAKNVEHGLIVNVLSVPTDLTDATLENALQPIARYAVRRAIQAAPAAVEAHANAGLRVLSIVCSYQDMKDSVPDGSQFSRAKTRLAKTGTLLILRDLPAAVGMSEFLFYGFDGFAIRNNQ